MSFFIQRVLFNIGLSQHVARLAANDCLISCIDARKVIWHQGETVESWDLVLSGVVAVSQYHGTSDSRLVHFFTNGAWYGEHNIVAAIPSCLAYHTLDQADLMRMPARLFRKLLDEEPAFSRFIARLCAMKGQLLWDSNTLLKTGNPSIRVAGGLALCTENISASVLPSLGDADRDSHRIPLKQELLAHYCGVSRTVFSKHLQTLMTHGLIKIEYSEIELVSLKEWRGLLAYLKHETGKVGEVNLEELIRLYRDSQPSVSTPT